MARGWRPFILRDGSEGGSLGAELEDVVPVALLVLKVVLSLFGLTHDDPPSCRGILVKCTA
jgi:hypothetical protein